MPTLTLILASASPARRRLLHSAGVVPLVIVSNVDEDAEIASLSADADAETVAEHLAVLKARDVGRKLQGADPGPFLVLGCDSVLEFDGRLLGKPTDANDARDRWRAMRGRTGTLVTGHALIDAADGGARVASAKTVVRFGTPDDAEIDAYVASGEPLTVAGAFTLDGLSAPFIDGIDGDPSNVIGLSLPLLRELVRALGHSWTDLWDARSVSGTDSP
ncbi:MAG: Maf family protein [Thermoleophilia bacterium]